jgi:ribosome-binding ATPase YchF (GTP1/OBG family)
MKITDLVYIKSTNSLGFVIDVFEDGDVRTDVDGVRSASELQLIEYETQLKELPMCTNIPPSIEKKLKPFFQLQRELYYAEHNIKKCHVHDYMYDLGNYKFLAEEVKGKLKELVLWN